jgi:drug/metabolite transporter (DMT)-like permease
VGLSVVLWSTAYVLSAVVLTTASPAVLSELRLVLAVPPMVALVVLRRRRGGWVELFAALRDRRTVVLGVTGVALYYLPSNLGLSATGAGTAALMSASLPVLTAVLAWWMLRERLSRGVLVGLVLATAGIALASAGAQVGLGAVLLVAGLVSYALYTVLLRRWATPDPSARPMPDTLVLATATAVWGALVLAPWLGAEALTTTIAWPSGVTGWFSILILSLVVTVPTMVLFNYGAERVPAAISGTATAGVPVLGYAFALLLGEAPQPLKLLGGAITLVGIAVAGFASRPRATVTTTATVVTATAEVEAFSVPERASTVSSTATADTVTGEIRLAAAATTSTLGVPRPSPATATRIVAPEPAETPAATATPEDAAAPASA